MNNSQADLEEHRKREFASYLVGIVSAIILTCMAFAIVHFSMFDAVNTRYAIFGLALVQVIIHFRYFLHIDFAKSARDDLQLILFSSLIVAIMTGGTLVILFNLQHRMM